MHAICRLISLGTARSSLASRLASWDTTTRGCSNRSFWYEICGMVFIRSDLEELQRGTLEKVAHELQPWHFHTRYFVERSQTR